MANKVLKLYPEIDYALIERTNEKGEVYEWVCAWAYDEETNSWGQGHYFFDLNDAYKYIQDKLDEYWDNYEREAAEWFYSLSINNEF